MKTYHIAVDLKVLVAYSKLVLYFKLGFNTMF